MQEPKSIYQDDELMIRWLPGNSDRLVLAFSGIRHGMGGMPIDEFIGTASEGASNHVLFVSDMMRSWYSRSGLTAKIVEQVESFSQQHGITRVDAVGNSMGGYGAIRFCSELPIKYVAAFAPQISMDLDVVPETAWERYRSNFGDELLPSLVHVVSETDAEIFVTFGTDLDHDREQAALLPDLPNLHLRMIPHSQHNVVNDLKAAGVVAPLVNAMLRGETDEVSAILDGFERRNKQLSKVLGRKMARFRQRLRWQKPRRLRGRVPR